MDTPTPIGVHLECVRGSVTIEAADTAVTHVDLHGPDAEATSVRLDGDQLTITPPRPRGLLGSDRRLDIAVTLPAGSRLAAKLGSAELTTSGELRTCRLTTGSGRLRLATVGDASIGSGSGDVHVEEARGDLEIKVGSGDVVVGNAHADVAISSGSGDVRLGTCHGAVTVKSGSGDLRVASSSGGLGFSTGSGDLTADVVSTGRVQVKGGSGDVRLGVPAGTPVWTDVSTVTGRIRSELVATGEAEPGQPFVEVVARTVSGDVVLTPAAPR
ncbi:DUF4097 family beta strand repeat-containing protein [Nocardioides sp. R-C-SC26]|uniref:DUF4097 family beta strand repeat-containing protein n=1 Tax=Nocardioides sp. R-C-SC26 TaxID=2870414 RepID=UPI001E317B7A|nr:DUF4097 family beta strand repeat-containing protein [Nocardioides sp. R-C-SC26]